MDIRGTRTIHVRSSSGCTPRLTAFLAVTADREWLKPLFEFKGKTGGKIERELKVGSPYSFIREPTSPSTMTPTAHIRTSLPIQSVYSLSVRDPKPAFKLPLYHQTVEAVLKKKYLRRTLIRNCAPTSTYLYLLFLVNARTKSWITPN